MINKVNHANGITLPNGRHFEAQIGSTRWFTARQAERGIAEVREIVDKAVELAQRMFSSDAEAAFDAMIEIATKYGINIQAATMVRGYWNDFAELAVLGVKGEEAKAAEAAEWQSRIEKKERKNASFREETAITIAMMIVEGSKAWSFWSKNGWFAEAELPEVEEQVAEVAEVKNEQTAEVAEAECNEQVVKVVKVAKVAKVAKVVENNEAEEVKVEVEEDVSTGRLVARMFDASNPERAFAAMVKIVNGGFNIGRVLGFSFSKLNVGGKVINTNQLAFNMTKPVTSEFKAAAVEAWKSLLDRTEKIERAAANTAEALGVEIEAEPEGVEQNNEEEKEGPNCPDPEFYEIAKRFEREAREEAGEARRNQEREQIAEDLEWWTAEQEKARDFIGKR